MLLTLYSTLVNPLAIALQVVIGLDISFVTAMTPIITAFDTRMIDMKMVTGALFTRAWSTIISITTSTCKIAPLLGLECRCLGMCSLLLLNLFLTPTVKQLQKPADLLSSPTWRVKIVSLSSATIACPHRYPLPIHALRLSRPTSRCWHYCPFFLWNRMSVRSCGFLPIFSLSYCMRMGLDIRM